MSSRSSIPIANHDKDTIGVRCTLLLRWSEKRGFRYFISHQSQFFYGTHGSQYDQSEVVRTNHDSTSSITVSFNKVRLVIHGALRFPVQYMA
ncbi:hypothetical protein CEXT_757721 [Caerostris extrusa]|uniref:Uncharacterized protein n=1 Tax=Caerostris extrusa TaxID=172846 RepID=A0AAV4P735_CAEEX|nr:hypothetical protein CEXT_757721 [Caerostris extrusa]